VLFLDDVAFNDMLDVAKKMHYEYTQTLTVYSLSILKLYCQILIEKLNRVFNRQAPIEGQAQHFKTTLEFKSLVYQNIHKTKTVSDYAQMLYITEKTLINHIRISSNSTPKEFINALIIEESKAMLLNKASVENVAKYFNFNDLAHFSNFFRKKTGQSPMDFKKNIK